MSAAVVLDGASLTCEDLARVAAGAPIRLDDAARFLTAAGTL